MPCHGTLTVHTARVQSLRRGPHWSYGLVCRSVVANLSVARFFGSSRRDSVAGPIPELCHLRTVFALRKPNGGLDSEGIHSEVVYENVCHVSLAASVIRSTSTDQPPLYHTMPHLSTTLVGYDRPLPDMDPGPLALVDWLPAHPSPPPRLTAPRSASLTRTYGYIRTPARSHPPPPRGHRASPGCLRGVAHQARSAFYRDGPVCVTQTGGKCQAGGSGTGNAGSLRAHRTSSESHAQLP